VKVHHGGASVSQGADDLALVVVSFGGVFH
jgi:hypothetical protein